VDEDVTLKRVKQKKDRVELIPSNVNMKSIVINAEDGKDVKIIGKMVGLLRLT
jgi:SOS-response transcriptional repressor LexA